MRKSDITGRCINGRELKSILKRGVPNSLKHIYDNISESQYFPPVFETGVVQQVTFNETTTYRGRVYVAGEKVNMDQVYVQVLLDAGIDVTVTDVE